MRRKVGTIVDEGILRRAKEYSASKEIPMNQVIEEALEYYLDREVIEGTRSLDEVLKARAGEFAKAGKVKGAGDTSDADFD